MFRRIQFLVFLVLLSRLAHAQTPAGYTQTNLVSDGSVMAQQTDPQLINAWGIAIGQQTPFWINTAGTGLSEVYDAGGRVPPVPRTWGPGNPLLKLYPIHPQPIADEWETTARGYLFRSLTLSRPPRASQISNIPSTPANPTTPDKSLESNT